MIKEEGELMINKWGIGMIAPILMLVCFSELIWWMSLDSTVAMVTFIIINALLFSIQTVACSVLHTPYIISLGGFCFITIVIVLSKKIVLFSTWINVYVFLLVIVYGFICLIEFKQKLKFSQNSSQK